MAQRHFDCVIVGAGSAGCVLAARLSEDANRTVLLLEAGADFPDVESMPEALTTGRFLPAQNPGYIWTYEGVGTRLQPDRYAVIRGKVLGGSGAINGANFVRNVPEDFDAWDSELWSFDAVLPFFRKLETDRDFDGELHGNNGPILVGRSPREEWGVFHEVFYDAALEAGFPEKRDLSDSQGSGVGSLPRNDITGLRMNCAITYLNPARSRSNLTVQPETQVLRVVVENGRATGVEVSAGGQVETISAGEVILSAGGIESPHILLCSGIGPAADLEQLGIPVVADLPVGENLTDHGTAHIEYMESEEVIGSREPLLQAVGLIYTAPGSQFRNDLRIQSTVGAGAQASSPARSVQEPGRVSVNCILDKPTTAGKLSLTSADPSTPPLLDYRYLTNDFDLQRMRAAVRDGVRIIEGDGKSRFVGERLTPVDADLASDESLDEWLLSHYRTAFHTCGTAKLGRADDESAVVDEHCRVRGVEGLRVADLSIAPSVGRASMNPTAIMIGERAAALIEE